MQLLALSQVEPAYGDRVYRHSRPLALLAAATATLASFLPLLYAIRNGWRPGWYVAVALALVFLALRRYVTASFRASNWLVRLTDRGLFLQLRSYLNYHLPAEDPTVVFLAFEEIRSARLVRERVRVPSSQGRTATQTLRYVELELGPDPAPLLAALQAELADKAPAQKRWYGTTSTLYQDHPAQMPSPPFLQVLWSVRPGAGDFLDALAPFTTILETVLLKEDLAGLEHLPPDEQEERLLDLVRRGQLVPAVYTARRVYGCGLAEARELLARLQSERSGSTPSRPETME